MSTIAQQVQAAVQDAAREGVRRIAEEVLRLARENAPKGDASLDPHPDIALEDTGKLVEDDDGIVIIFTAPYAAKQHEDVNLKHPRGGGPKFLQTALETVIPRAQRVVAHDVLAHMRRDATSHRRSGVSSLQRTTRTYP